MSTRFYYDIDKNDNAVVLSCECDRNKEIVIIPKTDDIITSYAIDAFTDWWCKGLDDENTEWECDDDYFVDIYIVKELKENGFEIGRDYKMYCDMQWND